ncbi:hypothetical protein FOA52_005974 [Chlamydomonas sp. UWO 241]|nr:hypothetical protein FOA52_005974 [Chlamydomonas sp. UWO 241]
MKTASMRPLLALLVLALAARHASCNHDPEDPNYGYGYYDSAGLPVDAVATGELAVFPYCRCDTYKCEGTPYKLVYSGSTVGPEITDICFDLELVGCGVQPPGPTSSCCRMISDNLNKMEFEVGLDCKSSVDGATINGEWSTMYFITTFATGVVRLPALDILDASGNGTKVCIQTFTNSKCNSPETLFESGSSSPKYAMFESSDHSPWRLAHLSTEAIDPSNLFLFALGIDPTEPCYPISFRVGNCCTQTLNQIALSLDRNARVAFQYAKVHMTNGTVIAAAVTTNDYGISIVLPEYLYIDTIPAGEYWTVEVSFDSLLWPDTTRMPCRETELELGVPACDYVLTGWQTAPGDVRTPLVPTPGNPDISQCCPGGVVQFCDSAITGSCNPRLSDTPWRLSFNKNETDGVFSTVFFDLNTVPVVAAVEGGCENPGIDAIVLTINPAVRLTHVLLNGLTAPFTNTSEGIVVIDSNIAPGAKGFMMLTFAGVVGASDVCSDNLGSYMACKYQLFGGTSRSCCTEADVPVEGQAGRLLAVWQRINVAVTCSKHKLVMIGCADTLRGTLLLGALLDMMEAGAWKVALPSDVLTTGAEA